MIDPFKKRVLFSDKTFSIYRKEARIRLALAKDLGRIILYGGQPIHRSLRETNPFEFFRQEIKQVYESNYFARALLIPEDKTLSIMKEAKFAEDPFNVEGIINSFEVSRGNALRRIVEILKINSHYINIDHEGKLRELFILDEETYFDQYKENLLSIEDKENLLSITPISFFSKYKTYSSFVCFPSGNRYFYHSQKVTKRTQKNDGENIIIIGLKEEDALQLLVNFTTEIKKLEVINIEPQSQK